jgi:hypothetical protein
MGLFGAPFADDGSGSALLPQLHSLHPSVRRQGPLVRRQSSSRFDALRLARVINRISGDQKKFFLRAFPQQLYEKYGSDPNGLIQYYRENLEWVYRDRVFRVDHELKALGIDSNRRVETLDRLVKLLKDETHAETARKLLARYTDGHTTFDLQNGRDRIYFTDIGGYKFKVVPEGY